MATIEQHTLDTFHAAALLSALPRLVADRLPLPALLTPQLTPSTVASGRATTSSVVGEVVAGAGAQEGEGELGSLLDSEMQEVRVSGSGTSGVVGGCRWVGGFRGLQVGRGL